MLKDWFEHPFHFDLFVSDWHFDILSDKYLYIVNTMLIKKYNHKLSVYHFGDNICTGVAVCLCTHENIILVFIFLVDKQEENKGKNYIRTTSSYLESCGFFLNTVCTTAVNTKETSAGKIAAYKQWGCLLSRCRVSKHQVLSTENKHTAQTIMGYIWVKILNIETLQTTQIEGYSAISL